MQCQNLFITFVHKYTIVYKWQRLNSTNIRFIVLHTQVFSRQKHNVHTNGVECVKQSKLKNYPQIVFTIFVFIIFLLFTFYNLIYPNYHIVRNMTYDYCFFFITSSFVRNNHTCIAYTRVRIGYESPHELCSAGSTAPSSAHWYLNFNISHLIPTVVGSVLYVT